MQELITAIQQNAPTLVVVAAGFWRVIATLHSIDRRLIKVETKMEGNKNV